MIGRPIVFILGAGASYPFNYPLGYGLYKNICYNLRSEHEQPFVELKACGFDVTHIESFRNRLFYSGLSSVDLFLEHNPEFVDVGKTAIAQVLIPHEREHMLFDESKDSVNWYKYIYSVLLDGARFDTFTKNKVGFITFNYDRSLEQFLFMALKNTFGESDENCAKVVREIPIIHVYGHLGHTLWQKEDGRKYHDYYEPNVLKNASSFINIIPQSVKDTKSLCDFQRVTNLLYTTEALFFLGFGYSEINLMRLPIPNRKEKNLHPIVGTSVGLKEAKENWIRKYFNTKDQSIRLDSHKYDALNFLKTYLAL